MCPKTPNHGGERNEKRSYTEGTVGSDRRELVVRAGLEERVPGAVEVPQPSARGREVLARQLEASRKNQ